MILTGCGLLCQRFGYGAENERNKGQHCTNREQAACLLTKLHRIRVSEGDAPGKPLLGHCAGGRARLTVNNTGVFEAGNRHEVREPDQQAEQNQKAIAQTCDPFVMVIVLL